MAPTRVEVLSDTSEVARRAADLIAAIVTAKPDALLGLPTGRTPIAAYEELARRMARRVVDLSRTTIYAVDEFAGATRETLGTNSVFYRQHVRLGQHALHCPNPAANDPAEHILAFTEAIRRAGGLDLCVLGIGTNGHIAFNEPGSARDSRARVVELTQESRLAHAAEFGALDAVPVRGMTLGVADLLESRAVIVLATGVAKAAAVARAIEGPQGADVPASWLQSVDALWVLDSTAAAGLEGTRR